MSWLMATMKTPAYATRSHAASFDRASLTGLNTRYRLHATTTSSAATAYKLRMPNRNRPSWPAMFLAVCAAFPGATSPLTATRYPRAESTDMARRPTPAVVLALRIDRFASASLWISPSEGTSSGGDPRPCRATDIVPALRDGVVGSVGRLSVAVFMVSPMVGTYVVS